MDSEKNITLATIDRQAVSEFFLIFRRTKSTLEMIDRLSVIFLMSIELISIDFHSQGFFLGHCFCRINILP